MKDFESPEEKSESSVGQPASVSGGLRAVVSAMANLQHRTGIVDGLIGLEQMNREGGFDCPGCAWPDPDERSPIAEYCENGAKAFASEATHRRVTPAFFAKHAIVELAGRSDYWLNDQGRLTDPMVRMNGDTHYRPIEWDQAFVLIAKHLNQLASPDEAIFYTSGRTSNEAAFLYQLFVRMFGTNNLPDCSNMCHESSGTGLNEVIGVGKGTVTLDDFEQTDTIVVIGQNPGTNHPRMLATLQSAKKRGATIIHVNPLREAGLVKFKHPQKPADMLGSGSTLADVFLQVRVNGDVALLKGIMKALLEQESDEPGSALDHQFIREYTDGFNALAEDLQDADWSDLEAASGIGREAMRSVVPMLVSPRRTIVCWAMGLTQHRNAVANIQMCVNLLLMTGSIGKPGAGACPVRGHSNVQGDRTMGIWDKPTSAFLDKLGQAVGFEPPRKPGLDTVESIQAMRDGTAKVFVALGGNFLSATPDTAVTAEALTKCDLTVQISTTLNRSHLVTGKTALILPCLGRTERDAGQLRDRFVTVENSMGIVHPSSGKRQPASTNLRSEPDIVAGIAASVLDKGGPVDWESVSDDYDTVRDMIAVTVPGFDGFNERIRTEGSFALPNAVRERVFNTATGRAMFTVHDVPDAAAQTGVFTMMTIRSHDQFNTTVYGLDDRYRGLSGRRRVVMMNASDIRDQALSSGQRVDLVSDYAGVKRVAQDFSIVPYDIPAGCVATYFPEANILVPLEHTAHRSNTPASKSVDVRIRPSQQS